MSQVVVALDTARVRDWATMHDAFADAFGFPAGYARDGDAWIECMAHLDAPEAGLTRVHAPPGGVVVLRLGVVDDFVARCPDQFAAILDWAATVNHDRLESGRPAVLAVSFLAERARFTVSRWSA